jgi:hypothetical protein
MSVRVVVPVFLIVAVTPNPPFSVMVIAGATTVKFPSCAVSSLPTLSTE